MVQLRSNALITGLIMLVFGVIVVVLAFREHIYGMLLFGTTGVLIIIAGLLVFFSRNESSHEKAGVKLIWAGWIALTMGIGGALLAPSDFYGLSGAAGVLLIVSFVVIAAAGLYTLIWANKKTGIPFAP